MHRFIFHILFYRKPGENSRNDFTEQTKSKRFNYKKCEDNRDAQNAQPHFCCSDITFFIVESFTFLLPGYTRNRCPEFMKIEEMQTEDFHLLKKSCLSEEFSVQKTPPESPGSPHKINSKSRSASTQKRRKNQYMKMRL